MHHLSIDLETYSSVPLAKAGAQKYIQSPDFEILLFAFKRGWCACSNHRPGTGGAAPPVAGPGHHQPGIHQARLQCPL